MNNFTITLPAEQLNVVLAGLDELKHSVSRRVVDAILQQVQAQQQAEQQNSEPGAGLTE